MYLTESKAGVFDTLDLPGVVGKRTLTVFRRRHGILPSPAVKLLEQLRLLTVGAESVAVGRTQERSQ